MKTRISPCGIKLTAVQRRSVAAQLTLAMARFGDRIDQVIVRLSDARALPGYKHCRIEVNMRSKLVSAEHSDINIAEAVEHAVSRVARSVRRTIETEPWTTRR